jgi:hypothetical protein
VVFPALARPMIRIRKRSHLARISRARYSSASERGCAGSEEEGSAGSDAEKCTGSKGEVSTSADRDTLPLSFDRSELNIDDKLCKCDEM